MVQGKKLTKPVNVYPIADGWSVSPLVLILLAFAATTTHYAQAQNIEGQPIAAQYGEFTVQNEGNGFAFDPANCNVTGGGENFPAFTTGTPVKVVDALPAQTEVSTAVIAFLSGSNCAVSLGGLAYQHTSFYLTSGTGGLQEALNNEKIRAGGNNTIILNSRWYELIAPRNASTVISAVSGSYSFGLVDVTTNPYTNYNWNGSQYIQAAATGGFPSGSAGGALSGNYPNPGLSSNPIALPAGSTATTCTPGENDTNVATNACVAAAAAGGGGVTPSTQYQITAFAAGGATVHGINVATDSTGNNLNIPAGALTLSNPGVFSNTADNFPNLTTVNGCSLTTIFTEVQYTATLTSALSACAAAPTNSPGTAYNQTAGIFAAATASGIGSGSGTSRAVGVNGYAIITGNNTEGFAMNPVVQDFNDSATGQQLIGEEVDIQPQKAATAYAFNGFGVLGTHYVLYNQGGQGGIYGPVIYANASNYGTPAYFGELADVAPGTLCPSGSCPVLNINAFTDPATSGANYGSPSLAFLYETYWNGAASTHASWRGPQAVIGSGTNPMTDNLVWSHSGGPAGMTSTFELAGGIQLQLDGATSGSAALSTSSTGGTLNLGSTNATVDTSGDLEVTSCIGCGSSEVPTAYSSSVTYPAGAIAYDGSGNNYSSLASGNVGKALSNTTYWHFLGGVSSTITGGNCVTSGNYMNGISTTGVPACGQVQFSNLGGSATVAQLPTGTSGAAIPLLNGANTFSGASIFSAAGATSTPGISITGAPFTGGTATTNFPQLYLNQGAGVTSFSTAGEEFAVNAPSGYVGNLINAFINGSSTKFRVDYAGDVFNAGYHTTAANGTASQAAFTLSGQPYIAGTATTNYPLFYLNNSSATAPTTWSTSGTELGINAPSSFVGNLLDFHINGGAPVFSVDYLGDISGRNFTVGNTLIAGSLASTSLTNSLLVEGGQNGSSSSALGNVMVEGGNNSGTGASGSAILQAGQGTGGGLQGIAYINQSFTVAAALSQTFEVVSMTTTANQVQAAPLGATNNIGITRSVGGTGTAIYVTTTGQSTIRFDGTPVIGDLVCAPPSSTGTAGLAHDNGATACAAGQKLGVVTSGVSGTGSGATATVLLQLGS